MSWSLNLFDAMTGLLAEPIDVPSLSWSLTVAGCALRTSRDESVSEGSATGLELPWSAVPGADRAARARALASWRRGLVLLRDGIPVVAGLVGDRTDGALDTSFDLVSPMDLLGRRYLMEEGAFGAVGGMTDPAGEDEKPKRGTFTRSTIAYRDRSLRAIVADIVRRCTEGKPGGYLPVDYNYIDEKGGHERTYEGWNVANSSAAKLIEEITAVDGGIDVQLRPYLADASHLRWSLEAGSDGAPLLEGGSPMPTLTSFRGGSGGTLHNVRVAWSGPTMRVYGTGSGQDEGTICHLSEDLSLCERRDPWPLVEATLSDTDWDSGALVRSHADAELAVSRRARWQLAGDVSASDPSNPVRPGAVWPGQPVGVVLEGFPSLPDGTYRLRLLEMSGDLTDQVSLTFDVELDPWEGA